MTAMFGLGNQCRRYNQLFIFVNICVFLFQCLLKIGDHIMNTTSDYEEAEVASDWRK